MKKLFTLILSSALCASAFADTTKMIGAHGSTMPALMGLGISPDGKYVCGSIESGVGYFIADVETNEVNWVVGDEDVEGNQLCNVNNNGLGIGYTAVGITYSFDGELTELDTPEGDYLYVLGQDLTTDGSVLVGALVANVTNAAYAKAGEEWALLPAVPGELLEGYSVNAAISCARYISADGKVILGHVGSFALPVVWTMNDAGEYVVDFFPARYLGQKVGEGDWVLNAISGAYLDLSDNGRYVALMGRLKDAASTEDDEIIKNILMVYDTEKKEMNYITATQEIDENEGGFYPTAISNDGTILGTIGLPLFGSTGCFVLQAGETQAKRITAAYPSCEYYLGAGDAVGFFTPTGISADGRYIVVYGWYCEDYMDEDAYDNYATFVIDTQGVAAGVEGTVIDSQAVPEAYYTIDGKRLAAPAEGFSIVRMSDGSVRKVINRR